LFFYLMAMDQVTTQPLSQTLEEQPTPQQRRPRWGALWHNSDFLKFWVGETISLFGSQVTLLALPLTAVLTLKATAGQLGLLRFLETLPYLLFPLLFGAWVDRRRRRPIMILANAIRAILIGVIPVLALLRLLGLMPLYAIAFCVGVFTILFEVCWLSFVPTLVSKNHLIEANTRVTTSSAAAEVGGPGLAGVLIQLLTAPLALLVDSLSYVVSVISLVLIRHQEPAPKRESQPRLLHDIAEGVRFAFGNIYLRVLAMEAAAWNFCFALLEPLFLLYTIRKLDFSPGLLGLVYAVGAVGGLLGSALAGTLAKHFRLGLVLCGTFTLGTVPLLLIPAASGPQVVIAGIFIAAFFLVRAALGIWQVLTTSLRQAITPNEMMGRTAASLRMLAYGGGTLGALAAGGLGAAVGLHWGLWLAGFGFLLALLPIFFSPLPRLRAMPAPVEDGALATHIE
jgi:MFS family permease